MEPSIVETEAKSFAKSKPIPPPKAPPGEDRAFAPPPIRAAAAPASAAPAPQAPAPAGAETSEVATTVREAVEAFASLQLAAGRMADAMLWRSTSWWGMPTLFPAEPLKGFGLPFAGLPPTDIRETGDHYLISLELPGLSLADTAVRIRGDMLVISGDKREETSGAGPGSYHVCERRFGHFERRFPLPADVDRDAISTRFHDGVLEATLPKRTAAAS